MSILMIVLEIILGLVFVAAGGAKLAGSKSLKSEFKRYGYPQWFMYLTGILEVTGAIGMFVGVFAPVWGVLAGLLLACITAGAVVTLIQVKDPVKSMVPAASLFVLALVVSAVYFF